MKKKYYVESNNGFGPIGVLKEFETYEEAKEYAKAYKRAYGVQTKVTF